MLLKHRIAKLELALKSSQEPDAMTLFWWGLEKEELPELPDNPPDDWVAFFNGKTLEDLLAIVDGENKAIS